MKLQRRHLKIVLGLLALALLYNLWSFFGRRASTTGPSPAPLLSGPTPAAGAPAPPAIDPTTIPAPPVVDLKTTPSWVRDPFLRAGETRDETMAQVSLLAPPTEPDPVVHSILFSPQRKLAVIQGRIYKVGDRVGNAEIVDIERVAVVIRTATGERRRVELQSPAAKWLQ
jgi:hypothetical protein